MFTYWKIALILLELSPGWLSYIRFLFCEGRKYNLLRSQCRFAVELVCEASSGQLFRRKIQDCVVTSSTIYVLDTPQKRNQKETEQWFSKGLCTFGFTLGELEMYSCSFLAWSQFLPASPSVSISPAESNSCIGRYTFFVTPKCLLLCWILIYFSSLMRKSMLISNKCLPKRCSAVILSFCTPCLKHGHQNLISR